LTTVSENSPREKWAVPLQLLDRSAVILSNACAVHCALTPILVSVAPLLVSGGFDSTLRMTLLGIGMLGVGFGCWLHKSRRAIAPLSAAVLVAGWLQISGETGREEVLLSLLISALLIVAHTLNANSCAKLCHHCGPARLWTDRVLDLGKREPLSTWALPLSGAVLAHALLFTLLAPEVATPAPFARDAQAQAHASP
jgi:hypothetical protein